MSRGARGAMEKLEILEAPDKRLYRKGEEVERVDDGVRDLMDAMVEAMREAGGIGLAAVQVGVLKRVLVMELEEGEVMYMANPELLSRSEEESVYEEGCLSVPEVREEVSRPSRCAVRYLGRDGESRELECEGLLSTCVQHEIDHLDGILFVDRLSRLKRGLAMKKVKRARREGRELGAELGAELL